MSLRVLFCCLFLCTGVFEALAQPQQSGFEVPLDTVEEIDLEYIPKTKANLFAGRPGRAALYSLILPGAGQAYNKKYWQVPIVWAGVGAMGYVMVTNIKDYKGYRDQYHEFLHAELEDRGVVLDPEYGYRGASTIPYTKEQVRLKRNDQNRLRQLSIIGFAAVWIANSAQAYVSAHLLEFDIDEDLSFHLLPLESGQVDIASTPLTASLVLRF
jgi:hypothetical protein